MNQISPLLRNEPKGVSINAWSSIKEHVRLANLGHQDRRIINAIKAQAEKLCFISPFYRNEPREELARLLATVTPVRTRGRSHGSRHR